MRNFTHLFLPLTCDLCEPPLLTVYVDAQVLPGREERGQLPPGGRNGPQAALQPAHAVPGPQVCSRQPLQKRAEVTVRGGRPASQTSNFAELKNPEAQTFDFYGFVIGAGLLPELPDSAGQELPPAGPETGVSAHPAGEQQVSQTGQTIRG